MGLKAEAWPKPVLQDAGAAAPGRWAALWAQRGTEAPGRWAALWGRRVVVRRAPAVPEVATAPRGWRRRRG